MHKNVLSKYTSNIASGIVLINMLEAIQIKSLCIKMQSFHVVYRCNLLSTYQLQSIYYLIQELFLFCGFIKN